MNTFTTTKTSAHKIDQSVNEPGSGAIRFWGAFGALALVVILNGFLRWMFSSDFAPVDPGPDPFPTYKLVFIRFFDLASLGAILVSYWLAICRPMLRGKPIGFDGKLVIATTLAVFLDPIISYTNSVFAFNAYAFNMGSWANFVPGHSLPGQERQAEGLFWSVGFYVYFGLLSAMLSAYFLRKLRQGFPRMTTVGRYSILFVFWFLFDNIFEASLVRMEVYSFSGLPIMGTLWPGEVYQYPIWEGIIVAPLCMLFTYLRESRDANDHSVAERGIDDLPFGEKTKSFISFLAILGFSIATYLIYHFSYSWMSMHAEVYPRLPSYLNGAAYCGNPGTGRLCASQLIRPAATTNVAPVTNSASATHVDGEFVIKQRQLR